MANAIQDSDNAKLVAVSSRKMATAEAFAKKHGVSRAFDSWQDMAAWNGIDAIYIATPTSVKEDIAIVAANNGKHVLGEKPFRSLPSLQNITAACRSNQVAFMDGTHFVHSPRTHDIQSTLKDTTGVPWSLSSAFHLNLRNKDNIRYNPMLEPQGALGDAGWYCMRAAVEYLSPNIELQSASSYLRRDKQTGAVNSASGVLQFNDGSTSIWSCGFETGSMLMDLRIAGSNGVIKLNDFVFSGLKNASYRLFKGRFGAEQTMTSNVLKTGGSLQFQNFAAMIANPEKMAASMRASERTQQYLDASWQSGIENEQKTKALI